MRALRVGMTRRSLSGVSGKDIACRNASDGVNDPDGERWKQREERSSEMDAIHGPRCVFFFFFFLCVPTSRNPSWREKCVCVMNRIE